MVKSSTAGRWQSMKLDRWNPAPVVVDIEVATVIIAETTVITLVDEIGNFTI